MEKKSIFAAFAAATILSAGVAMAADMDGMEKCMVNKDGKSMIKEHKNDCKGKMNSCAGTAKMGDPNSWIWVPKGECDKVNKGDVSGLSDDIKAKLDMDMMK